MDSKQKNKLRKLEGRVWRQQIDSEVYRRLRVEISLSGLSAAWWGECFIGLCHQWAAFYIGGYGYTNSLFKRSLDSSHNSGARYQKSEQRYWTIQYRTEAHMTFKEALEILFVFFS